MPRRRLLVASSFPTPLRRSHSRARSSPLDPAAAPRAASSSPSTSRSTLKKVRTHNDDQKTGVEIVRKALSWPARQIAINAGEDGSIVVGKILEKDTYAYGYDAQAGEYGNLISKGIIDPTKVVRAALQGAASVAGPGITNEALGAGG